MEPTSSSQESTSSNLEGLKRHLWTVVKKFSELEETIKGLRQEIERKDIYIARIRRNQISLTKEGTRYKSRIATLESRIASLEEMLAKRTMECNRLLGSEECPRMDIRIEAPLASGSVKK